MRVGSVAVRVAAASVGCALLAARGAAADGADDRASDAAAGGAASLDASAFVGVGTFGDSELGNSWAPEQAPRTSPIIGARVGWLAVPALARHGWLALALGLEAEVALAAAFTGEAAGGGAVRMSYFAPVLGWRAHALLRQRAGRAGVHLVLGAGGATVASSSPFMARETDPVAYAGAGATYALGARWRLRVDARQGVMPGRSAGATRVGELQLGAIAVLGGGARRLPRRPPPDAPDPAVEPDGDGDGIADRRDACPREAGIAAGGGVAPGCPAPDPDADGAAGAADACPLVAEDRDGFADADGCPDPDNDGDGLADAADTCPEEAEARNGYADADGCPDTVPDAVARALASAAAVRFEAGRARVTAPAREALRPVLALLEREPELRVVVTAAPERAGAAAVELAKRRAEAVKWHLVDQGIAADRIATATGDLAARRGAGPVLAVALAIAAAR